MEEEWSHPVFATREEFDAKLDEVIAEEQGNDFCWWYLSFADEEKFRGGLYIPASGVVEAAYIAGILGLNPGGQVKGWPITNAPGGMEAFDKHVPPRDRLRLLTKEEVEAQG